MKLQSKSGHATVIMAGLQSCGANPTNLARLTAIMLTSMLLASACGRVGTHSKASVESAINQHLAENRHLKSGSFETKVESVTFQGDTADAVVRFESRQSSSLFVEVHYGLRLEDGRWQVVSSAPMSGQGGPSDDSHNAPQDQDFGPAGTQPAAPPSQARH
jgi:hypothetical protein